MNAFLNKWYKNHALVYKILLFLGTTLFIVYLFPKTGKFRYSFEKGKPWQSENLYAPFNFAIKKSQNELEEKKLEIENNSPIYFEVNEDIELKVLSDYILRFNQTIKDSSYLNIQNSDLFKKGRLFVDELYDKGVLDQDYSYSDDRPVILATSNTILKELEYGSLYELSELRQLIEDDLDSYVSLEKRNKMISIYFDVVLVRR